ncbi:MAG: hypothetical protein JWM45_15 [Pseudonocardiales bacterium]|nr:hypothetical protein [Pseudonocardiales bacterium]
MPRTTTSKTISDPTARLRSLIEKHLTQMWGVDGGGGKGAVMGAVGVLLGLVLLVFELALVARMMLDWVGYWLPGAGGGRSRRAGWRTP